MATRRKKTGEDKEVLIGIAGHAKEDLKAKGAAVVICGKKRNHIASVGLTRVELAGLLLSALRFVEEAEES